MYACAHSHLKCQRLPILWLVYLWLRKKRWGRGLLIDEMSLKKACVICDVVYYIQHRKYPAIPRPLSSLDLQKSQ